MMRRLVIVFLICGGLGVFLQREAARGSFDAWHREILARLMGRPAAARVTLVELRRGDLPFESWPPSPLDYALIFESLVRHRPSAVAVQSLLAWPVVEPLNAATLAERIALLPRGVLACTLQHIPSTDPSADAAPRSVLLPPVRQVSGDLSRLPEFSTFGQVPVDEVRGSKGLGFTRIEFGDSPLAGESAVVMPMLARRGADVVPSLLLQSLLAWKGRTVDDVTVVLGREITVAPGLRLPIDERGGYSVHTRLCRPVRRVDAGALLLDLDQDAKLLQSQPAELATLQAINGSLVVLGETGETTPSVDLGGGRSWTEAELIAQGLGAALTGEHIREVPSRIQWVAWAIAAAAAALLLRCPRRWFAFFLVGGAAALALGLALVFIVGGWWLPPVPPLAIWLTGAGVAALLPGTRPPSEPMPSPPPSAQSPDPGFPSESRPPSDAPEAPAPPDAIETPDDPLARQLLEDAPLEPRVDGGIDPDGSASPEASSPPADLPLIESSPVDPPPPGDAPANPTHNPHRKRHSRKEGRMTGSDDPVD